MGSLISVIIPVYKVEKYLDRCLNSIVNQSYSNLEIILVDDGSPDSCPKKCEDWAKRDSRVTVLHKKNGGQSSARNYGLMTVRGKYVCFVDSDDWVTRDYIKRLYELITEHHADVAYCDFIRTKKEIELKEQNPLVQIMDHESLMKLFFRINGEKSSYAVWRGLYNVELVKNIRFVEGIITEDVPFTYEVYSKCSKAVFTNEVLYMYFINESGITSSTLCAKDLVLFDIWEDIYIKAPDKYKDWADLNRKRVPYTLYVKGMLKGKTEEITPAVENKMLKEINENYKTLLSGKILDWKRKAVLIYIRYFRKPIKQEP